MLKSAKEQCNHDPSTIHAWEESQGDYLENFYCRKFSTLTFIVFEIEMSDFES